MKTIYLKVEVPDEYDPTDHFPNVVFWSDSNQDYWADDLEAKIITLPTDDEKYTKSVEYQKKIDEYWADVGFVVGANFVINHIKNQ